MTKTPTWRTVRALAVIDKIVDVLRLRGVATTDDLALVIGVTRNHIGNYLRHMEGLGLATCLTPSGKGPGGSVCAHWGPGPGKPIDDEDDRTVVIRTQWAPIGVSDPFALPAGFFGARAAREVRA